MRNWGCSGVSGWACFYKNKNHQKVVLIFGSPNRIRTGVLALKGRCPRPLDDGAKTAVSLIERWQIITGLMTVVKYLSTILFR